MPPDCDRATGSGLAQYPKYISAILIVFGNINPGFVDSCYSVEGHLQLGSHHHGSPKRGVANGVGVMYKQAGRHVMSEGEVITVAKCNIMESHNIAIHRGSEMAGRIGHSGSGTN